MWLSSLVEVRLAGSYGLQKLGVLAGQPTINVFYGKLGDTRPFVIL